MSGRLFYLTFLSLFLCSAGGVFAGQAGYALLFDGSDDYVDCANEPNLNMTSSLTVEAWIKGTYGISSYHMVARKGAAYYLAVYEKKPYARIQTSTGWKKIQGNTTLNDNQWYHLAFAYTTAKGKKSMNIEDVDYLEEATGTPLISEGSSGQWDETIREIGNVLYEPNEIDPNKIYKAFYSGHKGAYEQNDVYVGYAYSEDGNNWAKSGKIIERALEDPYVLKYDDVYYLFAEDKADVPFRNIRCYHSNDCNSWVDDGDVFDIQSGGTPTGWESQDVSSPTVWIEDGIWYMLYEGRGGGYAGKVGLATSSDGLNWTRDSNNPIFNVGPGGGWDDDAVVPDDIKKVNGRYYMIYHGSDGSTWKMGMAYSDDLYNWTRFDNNPLLSYAPCMFFTGYDTEYVAFLSNTTGGEYLAYGYVGYGTPALYLNNVEETYKLKDNFNSESIITDSGPFNIGRAPTGSPFTFQGTIDDVRLYSKVLSWCERRRDMHGLLPGNDPNLVAYWQFDEGSGQTAYDWSSNGLDGHLGSNPAGADSSDPTWVVSTVDWENMLISDYDDSGAVDFNDMREFCNVWLSDDNVEADYDCDGIVNLHDYCIISNEW